MDVVRLNNHMRIARWHGLRRHLPGFPDAGGISVRARTPRSRFGIPRPAARSKPAEAASCSHVIISFLDSYTGKQTGADRAQSLSPCPMRGSAPDTCNDAVRLISADDLPN